jgi:preprotein translocase subunit SecD
MRCQIQILACLACAALAYGEATTQPTRPSVLEVRAASNEPVESWTEMKQPNGLSIFVSPTVVLSTPDFARAEPDKTPDGEICVRLTLSEEAGKRFQDHTSRHLNEPVAILLDGEVLMAPMIRSPIGSEMVVSAGQGGLEPSKMTRLIAAVAKPSAK